MKKTWEIEAGGVKHTIQYKAGFGVKIIVDGEIHKVKSSNWFINVVDYLIAFGETECRLVCVGSSVDLAVNGKFLKSGEPYQPIASVPAYTWALVGISTLGGMFFGGILCLLIGLLMSTIYVQSALKKKTGTVIGCFIGCTLLQVVLVFAVSLLVIATGAY